MKTKWAHHPLSLHVLLLAVLAIARPASAGTYSFTELAPLSGGAQSTAVAINNLGQVVGTTDFDATCFGCGGTTVATFWNGGVATQVPLPADGHSYAMDINDAGQIAGWTSSKTTTHYGAFLWNSTAGGAATDLNTIYYNNSAYAINNLGQVVGSSSNGAGSSAGSTVVWTNGVAAYLGNSFFPRDINDAGHLVGSDPNANAVAWNGTTLTVLGSLGGYSVARALNNSDQVVGQSIAGSGYAHATLWNNTTPLDLGTLGGNSSTAVDINGLGQIVGGSNIADGAMHAFLWDSGTLTDLNGLLDTGAASMGWVLVDAQGINDNGQIVGMAHNSISGQYSGYVLTPVPEPETYTMMLAGFGLVGVAARRRKR